MPNSRHTHLETRTTQLQRTPTWFVVFGLFAITGFLQFAAVDWSRQLSIYDEVPHVDYVLRLSDGDVTTWDDVYSQRTLGLASCLESRSPNPQCTTQELRDPQERWPNGHSYEASQTPLGYLPFVAAERTFVDDQADHFAQIRHLRLANVGIWILFAGLWTALVLQVTKRRLPAAAASVVVALNPLLFDRFTYLTNDGIAIAAATGVAAWLLYLLRSQGSSHWWVWIAVSAALGALLGLIKPTALIVLVPIALAAGASQIKRRQCAVTPYWWMATTVIALSGVASSFAYQLYIESRSRLGFETVLATLLPRGPLDLATASLLRIGDVSELVIGTGAKTELTPYEWGVRAPSMWVVAVALAGAAAFLVSLVVRNNAFPLQPFLDARIWALSIVVGLITMLIAHPALHYMRGELLMPFTAGRFQGPLVPLIGLALLATFQRFRIWAWVTIVTGLLIAAFASAPISSYLENLDFLI